MENWNLLKNRRLRCIEWTVKSAGNCAIDSEAFLFQNKNCCLQFCRRDLLSRNLHSLTFRCNDNGELQQPITVTLTVLIDFRIHSLNKIDLISADQEIWRYTPISVLDNCLVTFELIFHDDYSGASSNHKALQTPSYVDNCFLMEGIARDFSKMFDYNSGQDLEFVCGDQTIKAHKSVLSCRSDVFASMLQSDMSEGRTGRVNIEDMDATFFRQFLKCLYTGVLPTLTVDTAMKFYEAGDKYNVSSMMKQCADFLMYHLLPENAYDVLILADRHSNGDLKRSVIDFMVKEEIPNAGEKWAEFCKQYPMLAVEVYRLICQHHRPNEL